jgi:hypothetical protein
MPYHANICMKFLTFSMSLKFVLNKPKAFAKVWQERGLGSAVYDSLQYLRWIRQRLLEQQRYVHWLASQQLSAEDVARAQAEVETWDQPPTFSVLVPFTTQSPRYWSRQLSRCDRKPIHIGSSSWWMTVHQPPPPARF